MMEETIRTGNYFTLTSSFNDFSFDAALCNSILTLSSSSDF